jgi:uncharacterized membrane protein
MKRFASLLSLFAVVSAFLILPAQAGAAEHNRYRSVQWYDAQTNIASRWETQRASVEARVRDNHTDDKNGAFSETAYTVNVSHIEHLVRCIRNTKTCTAQ